jgi:hypothetical protein
LKYIIFFCLLQSSCTAFDLKMQSSYIGSFGIFNDPTRMGSPGRRHLRTHHLWSPCYCSLLLSRTVSNRPAQGPAPTQHCKLSWKVWYFPTIIYYLIIIVLQFLEFKGTVQRKLSWVKSGINRKLMIWAWAAWGLFYTLRGISPYNLNKRFRRLNDFSFGVIIKCGVRYQIAL